MTQKPPWEMTPEEFGQICPPTPTTGTTGRRAWGYAIPGFEAAPTRVAAVLDAHKYFVSRAMEEGVEVPPEIAALYRQPSRQATQTIQTEPASEAKTEDLKHQVLEQTARRLVDMKKAMDLIIMPAMIAQKRAMKLCSTVHDGLTRAMNERAAKFEQERADMRTIAAEREAELKASLDKITATMRAQAQILAARSQRKAKPKRFRFEIRRDTHGNIEAVDAEPC